MDTLEKFVLVASGDEMAGNLAVGAQVHYFDLLFKPPILRLSSTNYFQNVTGLSQCKYA